MNRICFMTMVLVFYTYALSGQERSIEITYKRNDDRSIDFFYNKKDPGSWHLTVEFNRLENANDPHFSRTVNGISGSLFKLRPDNPNQGIGFSYRYRYARGKLNPKVDRDFVYVLPFAKGTSVKTGRLKYLSGIYGDTPPKDWRTIQFLAQAGDTVHAARKGIVVDVLDTYVADRTTEYTFKNKSNHILVEHRDGSFANYQVLKKGSFMVKKGETVYPMTALALAGSYDSPENSQMRFSVYYLYTDKKKKEKETPTKRTHFNAFIDPKFQTRGSVQTLKDNSEYISDYAVELIEKEMSKRERKKRQKGK